MSAKLHAQEKKLDRELQEADDHLDTLKRTGDDVTSEYPFWQKRRSALAVQLGDARVAIEEYEEQAAGVDQQWNAQIATLRAQLKGMVDTACGREAEQKCIAVMEQINKLRALRAGKGEVDAEGVEEKESE
ncbi:MAG: hypothetical protein Faunusvirus2_5 [Faunusvirus sp.]|uniref:Uncharacterized protein n=1 Tax=Faunusvirus sp. TaxID=2487766 RepID=A0A3G4ZVX9_9VIRU|nr:MAG: hypothetical protein Faunusvirus2_5 [Faunusvirus sp.]